MIDYIIISKVITKSEYQHLSKDLFNDKRKGIIVNQTFRVLGFHSITLWMFAPTDKTDRAGTINVDIQQGCRFLNNDSLDVQAVLNTLDTLLQKYTLKDDTWRIAGMGISINLPVGYTDLYMDFIKRSAPSPKYKLKHTQEWDMGRLPKSVATASSLSDDDRINLGGVKAEQFENKALTTLFSPVDDNVLSMKIGVRSEAFYQIPEEIGVDKRDISSYVGKLKDITDYFIKKCITDITGNGDYYTLSAAEEKIRSMPDISRKEKYKYLETLKGIQKYKSVEAFLHHAGNGEVKGIKNRPTAERCLRDIDIHGINIVCISVRQAPDGVGSVGNLGNVLYRG